MGERRLTMHNSRAHKGGKTFSAKHNDHTEENGKWDVEKRDECYFWKSKACPGETYDEGEKAFYERYFRKSLDLQNERHKKTRHLERIKTIDNYRKSKNYCPEETLFYLGDKESHVPKEQLLDVMKEYVRWHTKEYPLAKILNFSLHADEEGAPHVHLRKVWMAKDGEGNWMVGQNKSLEQMGVALPYPDEPRDAQNNAKVTYTKACREKLIALCKDRGIELITEPRAKGEQGLSQMEYRKRKEAEEIEKALETKNAEIKDAGNRLMAEINGMVKAHDGLRRALNVGWKIPENVKDKITIAKDKADVRVEQALLQPMDDINAIMAAVNAADRAKRTYTGLKAAAQGKADVDDLLADDDFGLC